MTQRFGGLFSSLNRRDLNEFYKAIEFAEAVGGLAGDIEDYKDEIKTLEIQPLDVLIEIAEVAKEDINFYFFDFGGPGEGRHKEMSEEMGADIYFETIGRARVFMTDLDRIIKKLKAAQHKLQNEALD
jgi:hypothetical protein